MPPVSSKKGTRMHKIHKTRNKIIIISSIIIGLILFEFSPFGYNILFYSKWISCGQKPVATASSGYFNVGVKHYYMPPNFTLVRGLTRYFCTPIQAERAGYSANENTYDFPHLKAAGEPDPFLKEYLRNHQGQK